MASSENQTMDEMYVTKRSGDREIVSFDKILQRIKKLGSEVGIKLNYTSLVMKVIDQLYDGISTTKIDELSAEQCASLASTHPDYNTLAGRIVVSNHHKNTPDKFSDAMQKLFEHVDKHGKPSPLISSELYDLVVSSGEELDAICDYNRDYLIDYFGFKTLDRAYLTKVSRITIERPQHMWLRVAIGIHGHNMEKIRETYDLMSQKYFTHATPTLFNAGTPHPQLSSCYLLSMESDSIEGIYNTLKDCALISKWAGGIGLHIHNVRASGSHIRGTNGSSNGIVPMLRVFNNTAKYVDQCVTPNTIIYTRDGPMAIEDCIANTTEVANRNKTFEVVGKVLEHTYEGSIHEIQTILNGQPLNITPEHPIYVIKKPEMYCDQNAWIRTPEWVDAKDVVVGDYIVHVVPNVCFEYPDLTDEICYMYGIILSGMCIAQTQENANDIFSNRMRLNWMHIIHSPNKISELARFFSANAIHYEIRYMNYYNMIMWERNTVLPFTKSDFIINGKLRIGKRWLHLGEYKTKKILEGLGNTDDVLQLSADMQYLHMRIGRLPEQCIAFDNFWLVPVISNTEKLYNGGVVYDLQMTYEHNYMLAGGLVHNGGGKRNGSFAIYLEPWHSDIEHFLQMRKNHGDEELKARDLFYALWIPDLFMERVKSDGMWTLMCPDECPGLSDVYGLAFKELYEKYEADGRGRRAVKARELWFQVLDAQMETGTPYLLYKDACNQKSNQKNVGTIKSSNLCVAPETLILTDNGHIPIHTLCDKSVNVWNGLEWSHVIVRKTGQNQELIEVKTSMGTNLYCTKYHKFYVAYKNAGRISIKLKEANELKIGDKLVKCEFPIIESLAKSVIDSFSDLCNTYSATIVNGCITIECSDYTILQNMLYDLQTCGISSIIYKNNITFWVLKVYSDNLPILNQLGFNCKNIDITTLLNTLDVKEINEYDIAIVDIVDSGRIDDTYCFTEPKRHMGIFNGILTGQCTEILEYSDENETAVCNLASIALPAFVDMTQTPPVFNYEKLHTVTQTVTYNLNRIIDVNYYPTEKTRVSNMRHRPIGIGVQGLADVFMMMNHPFISDEAKYINRLIFETIYHAALTESCNIAKSEGPYSTFEGSPASLGELQYDMWKVAPTEGRYDWDSLKAEIRTHGLRNSLLLAPMPTASTSQILGYNECIEPITSNIYSRRTIAGEFIMANRYLMNDLLKLDLWNEKVKNSIIANHGSIQHIDIIPQEIRDKYKTVWELPMRHLIDMAADRGAFICQSQSLNLWLEDPNYSTLTSMHFYSWSKGLKTGIYYLRRRGRHQAQQFTIEPEKGKVGEEHDEICEMCSS
uniref:ribonucleoside-diphosphate reductase n=1 Tax=viral metagenome TaxID=1070528 RepID=A0A6C0HI00_9ZZZZ